MELTEVVRVFGVLFLVIALMVGVLHLMKRIGMPGVNSIKSGIRISGQCALGGRERLLVVEVDSRRFLLGVSPQGINNLSELEADAAQSDSQEVEAPRNFSRWLGGRQA